MFQRGRVTQNVTFSISTPSVSSLTTHNVTSTNTKVAERSRIESHAINSDERELIYFDRNGVMSPSTNLPPTQFLCPDLNISAFSMSGT